MSFQESNPLDHARRDTHEMPNWQYDTVRMHDVPYSDGQHQASFNSAQYYEMHTIQSPASYPVKEAIVHSELPLDAQSAEHVFSTPPLAIRSTLASWTFEILSVIVSVASIVAIIAVLHRENDRPLTAWKFGITLNTVIATLGTLARTTLAFAISACIGQQRWSWLRGRSDHLVAFERFDEASRGPYGSLRLFVWLRMRHWAALGALVIVGSVAFDPFLQAVITTYGRLDDVITNQDATIGYSLKADAGQIIEASRTGAMAVMNTSQGVFNLESSYNRPDFGVVSSIYNGFSSASQNNSESANFQCTTGNCTWPTYVSAAVCSKCADVSSELRASVGEGKGGSNVPSQGNLNLEARFTNYSLSYCNIKNWDLPLKGPVTNWWDYTTYGTNSPTRTFMTANTTYDPLSTIKFQDSQTLLMAFVMLRAGNAWLETKASWNQSKPIATECALYMCANAYQTKSENNILQDEVIGSWAIRDPSSYQVTSVFNQTNASAWAAAQGYKLYEPLLSFGHEDLRLLLPPDDLDKLNITTRNVNITHKFIRTITESFITLSTRTNFLGGTPKNSTAVLAFPDVDSPGVMDALWKSTNLTSTFDSVAKSITNNIRSISSEQNVGKTQTWVIHVRVNWAYLAYPISMLLIGIVYVICTIVESMRLRIPIWKESSLPTLLYGFDDDTRRHLREQEESKTHANDVKVRFAFDGDEKCMRLVET